jgi:hypothetical protein
MLGSTGQSGKNRWAHYTEKLEKELPCEASLFSFPQFGIDKPSDGEYTGT